MADLRRRCPECKRQFRPRKGTRRIYCERCRPSRLVPVGDGPEDPPEQLPGPVETATVAELADRVTSAAGAVAVRLAQDLDRGKLTGSQSAAVAGRLLAVLSAVTLGAPVEPDAVDELTARRVEKAASA